MAARNRPRALPKDEPDAHEERDLWTKIVNGLKEGSRVQKRVTELVAEIAEAEEKLVDGVDAHSKDYLPLEKLYEEHFQMAEKEQQILKDVLELNEVLIALRAATEAGDRGGISFCHSSAPTAENFPPTPLVEKKRKRKLDDGIAADSPSNRNTKVARSMSAAPSTDALYIGAEVAFRPPKPPKHKIADGGEWIQCTIVNLSGEGKQRRYEVLDPEPDEKGPKTHKASASALMPIPKDSTGLPVYPGGKQVVAMYPGTTCFYKAEVMGTKRDGTCRLKFEGEEEVGKEMEVERRFVFDVGNK